jgi:peptide/nickel transport system permease protein
VAEAQLALDVLPERRRWRLRVIFRRHLMGVTGVTLLLVLGVVAIAAPLIAPAGPLDQSAPALESPTLSHPFGTDLLGRDVFSRVIYGARISLGIGFAAVMIGVLAGCLIGVVSGYFGGSVDYLVQRMVEVVLAFPLLILLLVIVAAVGASVQNVILVIGLVMAPFMSRIVRAIVLAEKELPYIEAARALGASDGRILFRHLLPSVIPLAMILASIALGGAIMAEAGLSFLGLGVPPPNPSWGADLSGNARTYFQQAWWLAIFPGLALSLTILGANLLAEAVRDVVDPFGQAMR